MYEVIFLLFYHDYSTPYLTKVNFSIENESQTNLMFGLLLTTMTIANPYMIKNQTTTIFFLFNSDRCYFLKYFLFCL